MTSRCSNDHMECGHNLKVFTNNVFVDDIVNKDLRSSQSELRRRHVHRDADTKIKKTLLRFEEAPPYMRGNPYITAHYRAHYTVKECLHSGELSSCRWLLFVQWWWDCCIKYFRQCSRFTRRRWTSGLRSLDSPWTFAVSRGFFGTFAICFTSSQQRLHFHHHLTRPLNCRCHCLKSGLFWCSMNTN